MVLEADDEGMLVLSWLNWSRWAEMLAVVFLGRLLQWTRLGWSMGWCAKREKVRESERDGSGSA